MTQLFPPVRAISKTAERILKQRYYSEGEKKWSDLVERVVNHILQNEADSIKENTRQLLLNRYFLPNSPCLVNAGTNNGGLSACFVVDFPDNIEGIYKTKLDFALIARKGGGCGTSLEKIRPEGSKVAGSTHGYAGGGVKFADTISHDADALTQAGFRSMAIMFTESVYHPDIIKFITAKAEEGRIENANMSVVVDDKFMQAVEEDKEYWTEFNGEKYDKYKAREIFDLIIEGAWRNGEPGILFRDRINESPYKYTGQDIFATNPCLFEKTFLADDNSIVHISDKSNIKTWETGLKKCITLETNAGHRITLTPDHTIMLENGKFIMAKDSLGKQIKWGLGNKKIEKRNKKAEILGFLFGDGAICGGGHGISITLSQSKEPEMYKNLIEFGFIQQPCGDIYYNKKKLEEKLGESLNFLKNRTYDRYLPDRIIKSDYSFLGSFVSGLFEANGSVVKSTSQISFKATSKLQVQQLQMILSIFGIQSWIVKNKPRPTIWHNGTYTSRTSYNLQIAPRNAKKFRDTIGFLSSEKNSKIKTFKAPYIGKLKITNITEVEEHLAVWDFKSSSGYGVANGFIVHNCSEQPLPPNGSCNLGSLDLSKFIIKGDMNYEKLEIAVRLAVRFLDNVISVSSYPTKDIATWSKENRPIGLGIMGFADYCLMKEIAYGSQASLNELEDILSFISKIAEEESVRLGQELGIPKQCKKLPIPKRNITLTTIAPTGTVSLIAGCSSGIEPIFSEITIRNDKTGTYTFENNLAEKDYFRCAVSANGATEVTWEEHINILATAQKHIDSGVSKTINFPNLTRKETFAKAIMLAWKEGCKGVAMYRNGSRKSEVLTPKNIKKDKCPTCGRELILDNGQLMCTSCKLKLDKE